MDIAIISQGSMLASGASNPAVPGTASGARAGGTTRSNGVGKVSSQLITAAGSPAQVRMPAVVVDAGRKAHRSLAAAVKPPSMGVKGNLTQPLGQGAKGRPSTFLQKVLGGRLPVSWLTAGPKGR